MMATILDQANNALATPATVQMLGFVEPPPIEEALAQRIYTFILETIRIEDSENGNLFLKRFLDGPQSIWADTQSKIFDIKKLWSVTDCPDEYLVFLKNIVGWTSDLDSITDGMDVDVLRRLIASSAELWKTRGSEDSIANILALVIGQRSKILNWFDYRWVSDETGLGHEMDGEDPWIISSEDEQVFNIRIAGGAAVDRSLVRELAKLMRPTGERIEITHLELLDQFVVDGDDSQWQALSDSAQTGTDVLVVSGGLASMVDNAEGEEMFASFATPTNITPPSVAIQSRIRGAQMGVTFRRVDEDNKYTFLFDHANGDFVLKKTVAGADTVLGTEPMPFDFNTDPLVFQGARVETITTNTNVIRCYVDGVLCLEATDSSLFGDGVGFMHDSTGNIDVDIVEVMKLPAEINFIDINS